MKYLIQIVSLLVSTILALGILAPMLISAKDTLQVIFGFILVIVWTIFGIYMGVHYANILLKHIQNTSKEE